MQEDSGWCWRAVVVGEHLRGPLGGCAGPGEGMEVALLWRCGGHPEVDELGGMEQWFGVSFFPFWSERDGVRNACTRDPDLWAHKIAFRCGTN